MQLELLARSNRDADKSAVTNSIYIKLPFNLLTAIFGVFPLLWLIKWERNRKRRSGFPLIVASRRALCHNFLPVKLHPVTVYPSKAKLPRQDQLAWKIAQVAADAAPIESAVGEMVVNRVIDNASVAIAAANRSAPANARSQALAHPRAGGATVFGVAQRAAI